MTAPTHPRPTKPLAAVAAIVAQERSNFYDAIKRRVVTEVFDPTGVISERQKSGEPLTHEEYATLTKLMHAAFKQAGLLN